MKQLISKKNIICGIIIAVIIVVGLVIAATKGFNVELKYRENEQIQIAFGQEVEIAKVKEVVDEVLKDQENVVQIVEVYGDIVSIKSQEITDDQKELLITKINEKFELELSESNIATYKNSKTEVKDLLSKYILPFTIVWALTTVYFLIKYFKKGLIKAILVASIIPVIAQALLFSIVAIVRLPIGIFIPVLMIITYIIALVFIDNKLNK